MVTVIALLVAVPLGLGAALYLSEYASRRARKILKPTVELLAGVPSVVYGFFALTFVTPTLLQDILALDVGFTNALAAGLVLGVMIIPTIASLAEDAFSAVPHAMRQGSLAMGANRMQTSLRVVFPAALSGVAAAVVLGMSRAIGETMIVTLAAGSLKKFSLDPREGMQTMTGFMATTAGGENPVGSIDVQQPLRRRHAALRHHLVLNLVSISSSVASGRSTDEHATRPRARSPGVCHGPEQGQGRSPWSSWWPCGSPCSSASLVLLALIVDTAIDGLQPVRQRAAHQLRLHRAAGDGRLPRRHPRQLCG